MRLQNNDRGYGAPSRRSSHIFHDTVFLISKDANANAEFIRTIHSCFSNELSPLFAAISTTWPKNKIRVPSTFSYTTSNNKMTNVSSLAALKATISMLILIVLIATKLSFRNEVRLVEVRRAMT